MSQRIRIEQGVAWIDLGEAASAAEIHLALEELFAHPDFSTDLDVLYDCRRADFSAIPRTGLQQLATYLASRSYRPRKGALVVDRDVDYGVARMWAVYASGIATERATERRIFRDMDEAREWILSATEPLDG
jgi:hypothetical protein